MSIVSFPSEQALDVCIKTHPLIANDNYILEKGLVDGLANFFADRKVLKEDFDSKLGGFLKGKLEKLGLTRIAQLTTTMNVKATLSSCSCSNSKVTQFCKGAIQAKVERFVEFIQNCSGRIQETVYQVGKFIQSFATEDMNATRKENEL